MPRVQRRDARAAARYPRRHVPRRCTALTIALPVSDGTVTLRAPQDGDAARLIAGRDAEFHRWLGPGSPEPRPTAVIEVGGELAGWVDHDDDARPWLTEGQCNIGYYVFAAHRGRGIASRGVRLFLDVLRDDASFAEATFLIDVENEASRHVAQAVGAIERDRFPDAAGRPQVLLGVALARSLS